MVRPAVPPSMKPRARLSPAAQAELLAAQQQTITATGTLTQYRDTLRALIGHTHHRQEPAPPQGTTTRDNAHATG